MSHFPSLYGLYPNLPTALFPSAELATEGITWFGAILNNVNTAPYVMQYNLTVQRQLWPGTVFKVGYVGSTGVHEFSQIDANLPLPYGEATAAQLTALAPGRALDSANLAAGTAVTGTGTPGTVTNPFIGMHVNGNFAAVDAVEPISHSSYNSLQTSVTRQFSRDLAGNVGYTWSKCLDNGSATTSNEQGEWAFYDAYNPSLDRGPCSYNSNQVFTANAIYSLPFHANRAVSGWQISPIFTRFTGLPMNVQNMLFSYQSDIGGSVEGERPSAVPGCNPLVRKLHTEWWNPECFVEMPFGTIGTAGRDSIENPDFFNMDFSLMKTTKITERMSVQLRAEFFDIMNHPNFGVGQQGYLMSTTDTITPLSAEYSHISDPTAYEPPNPATGFAGGVICNPPNSKACRILARLLSAPATSARRLRFQPAPIARSSSL